MPTITFTRGTRRKATPRTSLRLPPGNCCRHEKPVASCLEENKGSEYLGSTLYSHLIPCRDPLTFLSSSSPPSSQPLQPLHSNPTALLMPPPLDHEMAFDDDGVYFQI